jgi:hypothetical protein
MKKMVLVMMLITSTFGAKKLWSADEDANLTHAVYTNGARNWPMVAALVPGRTAKQCRERWMVNLNPMLNRTKWTPAEDALIREKYDEFGPQWSKISKFLDRRAPEAIKNRWYGFLKNHHRAKQPVAPVIMDFNPEPEFLDFEEQGPARSVSAALDIPIDEWDIIPRWLGGELIFGEENDSTLEKSPK